LEKLKYFQNSNTEDLQRKIKQQLILNFSRWLSTLMKKHKVNETVPEIEITILFENRIDERNFMKQRQNFDSIETLQERTK
jgi:hypothetical protein